ncbi:MAG: hypothetical protein RI907_3220 [Pseudomonadota bacterium]|jgi:nucleoside-diphosphate-sugar epimerase
MGKHTAQPPVLLLTGATGQIGRRVLLAWCRQGHDVVLALRRPAQQWPALRDMLAAAGAPVDRVTCVQTDLAQPDLGWGATVPEALQRVTCVLHLGALWGWGLPWPLAERVNVQGALALHRWAERQCLPGAFVAVCGFMSQVPGQLRRLGWVAADGAGREPVDVERAARRWGAYEVSKMLAYVALQAQAERSPVPVTWIHPATVIADAQGPEVPSQSAVAGILQALSRGLMAWVPGTAAHRVPWVTGDYVARYTVALLQAPPGGLRDHVLMDPASPSLLASLRVMARALGVRGPWGHLPLGLMSALLALPGVGRALGTSAESLSFIVREVPDASPALAWGQGKGVHHPDVIEALACTARAWAQRSTS